MSETSNHHRIYPSLSQGYNRVRYQQCNKDKSNTKQKEVEARADQQSLSTLNKPLLNCPISAHELSSVQTYSRPQNQIETKALEISGGLPVWIFSLHQMGDTSPPIVPRQFELK